MATHDPQATGEKTTPALQQTQTGQPADAGDAPVAQQLGLNFGSIPWARLLKLGIEFGGFILTKLPQAQSAAGAKGQGGAQHYQQLRQAAENFKQAAEALLQQEDQEDQGELSEPK